MQSTHGPETLSEALTALQRSEAELQDSRRQITELRRELNDSDRGLIALHTELEAARHAEARLAAIVMSSDDAMISMSLQHLVETWNPGAQRLLGYTVAQIVGRPAQLLFPTEALPEFEKTLNRLGSGGHAEPYDTRWRHSDGTLIDVAVTVSAMRNGDGTLIGFSTVGRDITNMLAVQARLAVARADQEVMADRDRIARDLHDMVIQRVFGSALALQGTVSVIDNPRMAARVEAVIGELDGIIRDLRSAIFDLHNPPEANGLSAHFLELTSDVEHGLGFAFTVSLDGPIDTAVSDEAAVHLLAVLREALSNITRHARASAVDVTLRADADLVLRVSDNGCGFGRTTRTSGLANMRKRAQTLGGDFAVTSRPGSGTQLEWRIPLQ